MDRNLFLWFGETNSVITLILYYLRELVQFLSTLFPGSDAASSKSKLKTLKLYSILGKAKHQLNAKMAQQIVIESSQLKITCSLIIHSSSNKWSCNKRWHEAKDTANATERLNGKARAWCHNYNCNIDNPLMNYRFDMCRRLWLPHEAAPTCPCRTCRSWE